MREGTTLNGTPTARSNSRRRGEAEANIRRVVGVTEPIITGSQPAGTPFLDPREAPVLQRDARGEAR